MNKIKCFSLAVSALFALAFVFSCSKTEEQPELPVEDNSSSSAGNATASNPVSAYGALKACKINGIGYICGSDFYDSIPVQVRGVSLGWSNTGWESAIFFNDITINAMVDHWKAEIIRVPLGAGDNGSYLFSAQRASNKDRVITAIEAAIAKDVYVIIDWHSHAAHTSNQKELAKEFFSEMAQTYGHLDNVIFEIYNEPVCSDGASSCGSAQRTTWAEIKSYAEEIISVIREHSQNLILVGTPNWDQNVNAVLTSPGPLEDGNVAYVFHFYAATHSLNSYSSRINSVRDAGYPIFVTEYGTVASNGNGTHNEPSSDAWMDYLNTNIISYCAWHVNYKNEASAFFVPAFRPTADAEWANTSYMNASGEYIYNNLVSWHDSATWRTGNIPQLPSNASNPPASGSGNYCYYGACSNWAADEWSCVGGGGCYRMPTDDNCISGTLVESCPLDARAPSAPAGYY
jgi:endoglucanase|uniref:Glycoside hydrolase family 5 n=1 Tax=uncultured bacterium contig00123 TaxID=1181580 RepID=A0A806KGF3_9BACT|nr:glycoside hydrolase family 5 [uncultured bacterium contig00123]